MSALQYFTGVGSVSKLSWCTWFDTVILISHQKDWCQNMWKFIAWSRYAWDARLARLARSSSGKFIVFISFWSFFLLFSFVRCFFLSFFCVEVFILLLLDCCCCCCCISRFVHLSRSTYYVRKTYHYSQHNRKGIIMLCSGQAHDSINTSELNAFTIGAIWIVFNCNGCSIETVKCIPLYYNIYQANNTNHFTNFIRRGNGNKTKLQQQQQQ